MNQKYIITGAPGTGKTCIINELKERGFNCINENSREVISKEIITGGEVVPWKNQIAFENKITKLRTQQFLASPKSGISFFDRSAIDSIAYLKLNKLDIPKEIIRNLKKCNFNKTVFYTPIWKEIYVNDNERIENIDQAIKIESVLLETYKAKRYTLVKVPRLTITERADFIISQI